jgi:hypothetical protein
VALGKTLKAIHDTLMGPHYQLQVIIVTELHYPVRLQNQYVNLKTVTRIERWEMEAIFTRQVFLKLRQHQHHSSLLNSVFPFLN